MSKLCYKVGGQVKSYDLKNEKPANGPSLAVKNGAITQYLGLKQGSRAGEICVRVGGQNYYVQTAVQIGNSQIPEGGNVFTQTTINNGSSAYDDTIISAVFCNSNKQPMALLAYMQCEGNGAGTTLDLSYYSRYLNPLPSPGGNIKLFYNTPTWTNHSVLSQPTIKSSDFKNYLVNRYGEAVPATTYTIYTWDYYGYYSDVKRITYSDGRTYIGDAYGCPTGRYWNNQTTSGISSIGSWHQEHAFYSTTYYDNKVYTDGRMYGWTTYTVRDTSWIPKVAIRTNNNYPVISYGGGIYQFTGQMEHRGYIFVEFPQSGVIGVSPTSFISEWCNLCPDWAYSTTTQCKVSYEYVGAL